MNVFSHKFTIRFIKASKEFIFILSQRKQEFNEFGLVIMTSSLYGNKKLRI